MLKEMPLNRERVKSLNSIEHPDEVMFTNVSPQFLVKHGRLRCPCCKLDGIDSVVEIAPALRCSSRKTAAVCRDHEAFGRSILTGLWEAVQPDCSVANSTMKY
jgi:hypothetical protein